MLRRKANFAISICAGLAHNVRRLVYRSQVESQLNDREESSQMMELTFTFNTETFHNRFFDDFLIPSSSSGASIAQLHTRMLYLFMVLAENVLKGESLESQ
jgi:hypothetical protein